MAQNQNQHRAWWPSAEQHIHTSKFPRDALEVLDTVQTCIEHIHSPMGTAQVSYNQQHHVASVKSPADDDIVNELAALLLTSPPQQHAQHGAPAPSAPSALLGAYQPQHQGATNASTTTPPIMPVAMHGNQHQPGAYHPTFGAAAFAISSFEAAITGQASAVAATATTPCLNLQQVQAAGPQSAQQLEGIADPFVDAELVWHEAEVMVDYRPVDALHTSISEGATIADIVGSSPLAVPKTATASHAAPDTSHEPAVPAAAVAAAPPPTLPPPPASTAAPVEPTRAVAEALDAPLAAGLQVPATQQQQLPDVGAGPEGNADDEFELWMQQDERLAALPGHAAFAPPGGLPTPAAADASADPLLPPTSPAPSAAAAAAGAQSAAGGAVDSSGIGERVCWLASVDVGDRVEVAPLAGGEDEVVEVDGQLVRLEPPMVQGVVDEIIVDDPFQPHGVLVRLEDNTMGHVVRVKDRRYRQRQEQWPTLAPGQKAAGQQGAAGAKSIGIPIGKGKAKAGSEAAEAARGGGNGSAACRPAGGIKIIHKSTKSQGAKEGPVNGGNGSNRSGSTPAAKGSRGAGKGGSDGGRLSGEEVQRVWQALQKQYGEALTAAVLEDCEGLVAEAVEVLQHQEVSPDVLGDLVQRAIQRAEEETAAAIASSLESSSNNSTTPGGKGGNARGGRGGARGGWGGVNAAHSGAAAQVAYVKQGPDGRYHKSKAEVVTTAAAFPGMPGASASGAGSTPTPGTWQMPLKESSASVSLLSRQGAFPGLAPGAGRHGSSMDGSGSSSRPQGQWTGGRPQVKLLRNTDSLATMATAAGLNIRDAESLKRIFPSLDNRAAIAALAGASGDVQLAVERLLHADDSTSAGGPVQGSYSRAASSGLIASMGGSSTMSGGEEEEEQGLFAMPPPSSSFYRDGRASPAPAAGKAASAGAGGAALSFSDKVALVRQAFQDLDPLLAEFTLQQCGEDLQAALSFLADSVSAYTELAKPAAVDAGPAPQAPGAGAVGAEAAAAAAAAAAAGMDAAGAGIPYEWVAEEQQHIYQQLQQQAAAAEEPWQAVGAGGGQPPPQQQQQQRGGSRQPASRSVTKDVSKLQSDKARHIAQLYYDARNFLYQQAALAYSCGDGKAAAEYSARGREYGELAKKYRKDANDAAFKSVNLGVRHQFPLDLHGLHVAEALEVVGKQLEGLALLVYPEGVVLKIIVGKGTHSSNNVATIKPAVLSYLKDLGSHKYWVDPVNDGVVMVHVMSRQLAAEAAGENRK